MIESWRPVVGYEGAYEVSDLGRVRSLPGGHRRCRVLRAHAVSGGRYLALDLCVAGQVARKYVHHLVAEAFVGPRPEGLDTCHSNGDSHDNRAINLRYDTVTGNNRDATAHGRNRLALRSQCSHGHDFSVANTYIRSARAADGSAKLVRVCRACVAANQQRYRSRKLART